MAARIVSIDSLSHSRANARFNDSMLRCCFALTLPSNTPHMQKSSGLRSGDDGGHSLALINPGQLVLHHSWFTFASCAGAESCWKTQSRSDRVRQHLARAATAKFLIGNKRRWFLPPYRWKRGGVCHCGRQPPHHHRTWVLKSLNSPFVFRDILKWCWINRVVFGVETLLYDKNLLIRKNDFFRSGWTVPPLGHGGNVWSGLFARMAADLNERCFTGCI